MSHIVAGHHVRIGWLVIALGIIASAIILAVTAGVSGWFVALGLIGPDLAFFAAIGQKPSEPGRMPRRAVPFYNFTHRLSAPILCGTGSLLWMVWPEVGAAIAVTAVSWLGHIVWDRSVGYGLRDRSGAMILPNATRAIAH